jgi:2-dehydropantoate 2-reductase
VRVLVVGAGVIGTVYGACFAKAGHTLEVVAHGERTEHIRRCGLVARDTRTGSETTSPATVVATASGDRYDLVMVAVRFDNLPSAWSMLRTLSGDPTVLLFGNNPGGRSSIPSSLPGELRLGFPGIGGSFKGDTVEFARITQQPTALEAGPSATLDELDRTLREQAFTTQRVADMDGWLLYHAVFVASVSAALYRCDSDAGRLAADRRTLRLMCRAISEGFRSLRRQRVGGAPASLALLHRAVLRPGAVAYWARTFRSPMGDLLFADHARHAEGEMRLVGAEVLVRIPAEDHTTHLRRLLDG